MTHYRPRPPSAARSRRGFALIAVLWVITALAALLGVALATTRLGTLTTRNRVLLARDRWAAEACLAIAAARRHGHHRPGPIDALRVARGGPRGEAQREHRRSRGAASAAHESRAQPH